jgi:CheY-like chemotaxis protein
LLFPAAGRIAEPERTGSGRRGPSRRSPLASIEGTTILLVEDEAAVRKLVRKLLEVIGCEVIEAASGREALERWPDIRDRVSLVVSDIVMPDGVSGWDLTRELHQRHPDLGILLTSGYSELPTDHGLGGIPQIEFLQKPYGVGALKASLSRLVNLPR